MTKPCCCSTTPSRPSGLGLIKKGEISQLKILCEHLRSLVKKTPKGVEGGKKPPKGEKPPRGLKGRLPSMMLKMVEGGELPPHGEWHNH